MRTRQHNAALKKYRLINEGRAAKRKADPYANTKPPTAGERFDQVVAIREGGIDAGGNLRWIFRCDCGAEFSWRPSTVRSNVKSLGWCSCSACYHTAGGYEAIRTMRTAPAVEVTP